MKDETMPDPTNPNPSPAPTMADPTAIVQPPAPDTITTASGKVLPLTEQQIGKIKKEERAKGARQLAKELGFENVDAMRVALDKAKQRNAAPPAKPPSTPKDKPTADPDAQPAATVHAASSKEYQKLQRELADRDEKLKRLAREKAKHERDARDLRHKAAAQDAETELRAAAWKAGVKDHEYALHLLRRELAGKSEEQLRGFDETKFFEGLRAQHAYLFGEVTKPVHTAPAPGAVRPAPATGHTGAGNGNGNGAVPTDSRQMTREQFDARKRQLGLA